MCVNIHVSAALTCTGNTYLGQFGAESKLLHLKESAWRMHSCGQDVACDLVEMATG